jgi:hypothetical protein
MIALPYDSTSQSACARSLPSAQPASRTPQAPPTNLRREARRVPSWLPNSVHRSRRGQPHTATHLVQQCAVVHLGQLADGAAGRHRIKSSIKCLGSKQPNALWPQEPPRPARSAAVGSWRANGLALIHAARNQSTIFKAQGRLTALGRLPCPGSRRR